MVAECSDSEVKWIKWFAGSLTKRDVDTHLSKGCEWHVRHAWNLQEQSSLPEMSTTQKFPETEKFVLN